MKQKEKSNVIVVKPITTADVLAEVILTGDLTNLSSEKKVEYYKLVCSTIGLNPTTKPFDYIKMNGKEILYANKGCAEQLRENYKISIKITHRELMDKIYVVTAEAKDKKGRTDSATGALFVGGLHGETLANAYMKAETKAKRRVTLSICGLNILDEVELDSMPKEGSPLPPVQMDPPKPAEPKPVILQASGPVKELTREELARKIVATGKVLNLRGENLTAFIKEETGKDTKDLLHSEMEDVLVKLEIEIGKSDLCQKN